ncbi:hypothetical protein [Paenibacillus alvei]|uniref:hypothetical protein n=1 Tax=Paenibacillus TaxID=44249 RepID=UPI00227E5023|nr:hypothetical protein [Paenibacillus alvei]
MVLLKDSLNLEELRASYQQLWDELQDVDDERVEEIIENVRYELMPLNRRIIYKLHMIKSHLLWIIPLSVIGVTILGYVLFVWIALLVE